MCKAPADDCPPSVPALVCGTVLWGAAECEWFVPAGLTESEAASPQAPQDVEADPANLTLTHSAAQVYLMCDLLTPIQYARAEVRNILALTWCLMLRNRKAHYAAISRYGSSG